jgi:capsular exopolysaccharide synthesis family protein
MAEAVVTAYVQNGLERQNDASSLALERLKKDAEELQAKLIAAEHAVQEFKGQNEIVAMNDRQSLTSARLEKLNEELAEIERARNEAGSRLQAAAHATVDAALDSDLPEVLGSAVVGDCKRALMSTRAELSQLAQVYKPRHPHMLALASKAEAIEDQLSQEIASVQKGLQRQYERATLRETDVRRRLDEQTKALLELEGKVIQYDILRNEAEATRKLHDTVLNRLKEVQLIHGAETTNVHRIGPAEVSPRPVRPNKTLHLLLALLGGLLLGSASAWAIDLCDRTMKGADDVGACLGVPVLGQVPRFLDRAEDGTGLDPATEDERSAVSESFRTIRTALSFTDAGRDMRSLLVTSTAPEEGKSTVSINLAVAFARAGRRVLLVDADLRRPRLHRVFGVEGEQGFSALLIGSQTFASLVRSTGVENLWLLPCGVIPPNPVELLGSPGMRAAYLEMTASFDLVVFDSPPAGVVSDASVLATFADRAAFVVRSLHTNRTQAQRVVAQLQSVGSRIAGAIVNHSDVRAACYGGHELDYSYQPHAELVEAGS